MPRSGKDSRRAPRIPHDSLLELYDDAGGIQDAALKLVDVSAVGASFTTTRAFAKGAKIRGRVRLLNVGVMEIEGRIVRVKERTNTTLYAVEFDSIHAHRR
ncbi:MAG: PilZ domain-containing protein [Elusimicrobiota bacterium]